MIYYLLQKKSVESAAFGFLLFNQVPDVFSVVGFVLILTAVLILNSKGGKKSVA